MAVGPTAAWRRQARLQQGTDEVSNPELVWQAASAVTPMVTSNSSRSHEIWSLRALHANLEASED